MEKDNDRPDIQHEEMLNFSRQNMIDSLQLFFSHTKYSLTLLTTILAASLAITAFSFDKLQGAPEASKLALFLAAVFLILMGPVSYITHRLIGRYYRLYVSFYVYAARLHEKHSSIEHPWFADLKSRLGDPRNTRKILMTSQLLRIEAWPLGNRPTFHGAVQFKPEIIVQAACPMFLDDKR